MRAKVKNQNTVFELKKNVGDQEQSVKTSFGLHRGVQWPE